MEAAGKEFARNGYDLSSIQQIIQTSGIPRGSFYQYFDDKKDLFGEVMYDISCRKMAYMKPLLDRQGEFGIFDWIKELVKAGVQFGMDDPEAFRIGKDLFSSKTLDKEAFLKDMQEKLYARHQITQESLFMQALSVSMRRGEIHPDYPMELILVFIQGMMDKLSEWYWIQLTSNKHPDKADELFDQILSILRYGISKTNKPG